MVETVGQVEGRGLSGRPVDPAITSRPLREDEDCREDPQILRYRAYDYGRLSDRRTLLDDVKKYLLTPLLHPTTAAENLYNNAHIRTRNIVERVFGVWKRRFPVLSLGMRVKMETVQDIIVATAVLHNIARNHNEEEPPACCDLPDEEIGDNNENQLGIQVGDNNVRQALIDEYFS
ncbi:PREDICTED: putative nuclease HARBI1, partial [Vollenhovia emeryi]|uniref:putative nuclease HARBI1 n=1 Tax=Vollenhovia emeryi TaxID=411798 RepID=UPI0005F4824F